MNKGRHRKVMYIDGHAAASKLVSSSNFVSLQELDNDGLYEVCMNKEEVSWFCLFLFLLFTEK